MSYRVATVDELQDIPYREGTHMRPVRHHLGITAFGTNAWTAAEVGDRLMPEHAEDEGVEEMYVVLRGRATFQLDDEEVDGTPGTLVFVRPGTRRGAIAAEDDTFILAVGAKPGVVFEPSPWEDVFAAYSYAEQGDVERGRGLVQEAIGRNPDAWQGFYNAACIEARFGDPDTAIEHLKRSVELDPDATKKAAAGDTDFDSIRDRADYPV